MKNLGCRLGILVLLLTIVSSVNINAQSLTTDKSKGWCDKALRPELLKLKEIKTSRPWFKVYDVGNDVFAIDEPYNYEETIAYLIIGKNKALLFDTGMGMDSISLVVKELTQLPITVLNSHTHFDHIGGNREFSEILAMNTSYTRNNAANGYTHLQVRNEVTPEAFCNTRLPQLDTTNYYTHPFKVSKFIDDHYIIDLGNRKIQVITTPGHAPDAICLFELKTGYLWTGDSFYLGPIFLFDEATDLKVYHHSIGRMAIFAAKAKRVLPAHNVPVVDPSEVIKAQKAFSRIISKKVVGKPGDFGAKVFDFGEFSYMIDAKLLQ